MGGEGSGARRRRGRSAQRGRQRGRHLLVGLHFPAHHAEGIGCGVVVDLDSAEGLGAGASRQPTLVAVIVKHHSGPAGADNRLTARNGRKKGDRPVSCGEHSTLLPGEGHLLHLGSPGRVKETVREEEKDTSRGRERQILEENERDWLGKRAGQSKTDRLGGTKRQTGDMRQMSKDTDREKETGRGVR